MGIGSSDNGGDPNMKLGVRLAVASAVGLGALASGLLLSRSGRRLVGDAFRGKRRSPLTDRVLEALWSDPALGRRTLDVDEVGEGGVILAGTVASARERSQAVRLATDVPGVSEVDDRLEVDPSLRRRRRNALRWGRT
ncbi:MAG TPA: BON domain-containing protein [Longimicrobiales bacterium]|nr:BON domain-containing protein [Longimicrobiales bacterium]